MMCLSLSQIVEIGQWRSWINFYHSYFILGREPGISPGGHYPRVKSFSHGSSFAGGGTEQHLGSENGEPCQDLRKIRFIFLYKRKENRKLKELFANVFLSAREDFVFSDQGQV